MILDQWQEEALEHEGDLLLCTGRQVGKTTIMAMKAAKYMLENEGHKIIIVSLTEDQAKLIIVMILDYLEKNAKKMIKMGKDKPTQNRITLRNGSSAIARPVGNTGDAIRGFTGDVLIIDEASRMPELAFVAGIPTLMTKGGQIWMCSTPHGKQGFFWDSYNDKDNWKIIEVSSVQVIRDRPINNEWTEDQRAKAMQRIEKQKQNMSELAFGQEYLGLFLDELRQFFSDEWIDKVCIRDPNDPTQEGKNYLGCDLARMGNDESSFEIITEKNGLHIHQFNMVTKKTLTTTTESNIIEVATRWKVKKVGIDAGAGTLGVSILDHLLESKIRHKMVALNNRAISTDTTDKPKKQRLLKEDMYYNMLAMGEKGRLQLLNDPKVRLSLKSVQIEIIETKTGSRDRIFGKDTHVAEGLVRATWLSEKEKTLNLWVR